MVLCPPRKVGPRLRKVYNEESQRGGVDWERRASRRVNSLLHYFPADTWTPFVSLASHHMMMWILHEQGEGEVKNAVESINPELFLLMFSINETEFYKLKELRSFHAKRDQTLISLNLILRDKLQSSCGIRLLSLRVGDELCTIVVNRNIQQKSFIDTVLKTVAASNLQVAIRLIHVPVGRTLSKMRNKPYWVVNGTVAERDYALGVTLEEASASNAEWEAHLSKRWVAWVSVEPQQDVVECCRQFVENYAVKVLNTLPHKSGIALNSSYEFGASPDLMLSIFVGYQAFLDDVVHCLHPNSAIMRSFSSSLFALGVDHYSDVFSVYDRLLRLRQKLHIPINVSIVVTHSKFPFWRVIEIFYAHPNNITILRKGGAALSLNEKDFELINTIVPIVREIKSSVWKGEIVRASAKKLKELEFELDRLTSGSKRKLTERQREEMVKFVAKLEAGHLDIDEERRRRIRYEAFKRLGDFAGTASRKNRYR